MADGERVNIVDGNGEFSNEIAGFLDKAGITSRRKDYNVLAIMGCQSSGKSTLLNLLFGTNFDVMDASRGRSQTTRGIWMSRAKESYTLVMDLEGTDGRERGDTGVSFERKTALFALSTAELLLINLWVHDIGRRNAANYDLLKTVFEVNLQLAMSKDGESKEAKTTLLFVVRDFVEEDTPLELLRNLLDTDLNEIWNQMEKPEFYKSHPLSDFFEIKVTALPHKKLMAAAFDKEIENLKARFYDKNNEAYLLNTDERKRVPGDGLAIFAEQLWSAIRDNRDLDLPAQKELLSLYRCGEIADDVMAHEAITGPLQTLKEAAGRSEVIKEFGNICDGIVSTATQMFDLKAVLYQSEKGFATKREELIGHIKQKVAPIFESQLEIARSNAFQKFAVTMASLLKKAKKEGTKSVQFGDVAKSEIKTAMDSFMAAVTAAQSDQLEFVEESDRAIRQFCDALKGEQEKQRALHLELFVKEMKQLFATLLDKRVTSIIEAAQSNMWPRLRSVVADVRKEAFIEVRSRLASFGASDAVADDTLEEIADHPGSILTKKLKDLSNPNVMVYMMRTRFDKVFRYDQHNTPRVWRPGMDIPKFYQEAREQSLALLRVFSVMRLDEAADKVPCPLDVEDPTELDKYKQYVVLSVEDIKDVKDRFEKEIEAAFIDAKATQERNMLTQGLPPWVLILLVVLGFDEFMTVVTNPLYLFLVVVLGGGFLFLHNTGLLNPALFVAKETVSAAVNVGQAKLSEFQQPPAPRGSRIVMRSQTAPSGGLISPPNEEETKKDQ